MSDLLEDNLREALADRAAHISPDATARLRAIDYHERGGWLGSRRTLGVLGASGLSGAAAVAILLGSSAAPAFAGWTANPTTPRPGQLAAAGERCRPQSGTPVLTDTRGPYTASIYADGSTCIDGNGINISSSAGGDRKTSIPAGTVLLNGAGESDSGGHSLTMVDGPVGAGVSAVTISRSNGSSVQATVKNGWYLAWWPGTERAVTAKVTSATGVHTQSFPNMAQPPAPACPAAGQCSSGYGFATGPGHGAERSTTRISGHHSAGQ